MDHSAAIKGRPFWSSRLFSKTEWRLSGATLRAADDERRQAKRNNIADRLTVEAKALADLKIERAAVERERRVVEADLGPVRYPATLMRLRRSGCAPVFHPGRGDTARFGRGSCCCWRRRAANVEHVSADCSVRRSRIKPKRPPPDTEDG